MRVRITSEDIKEGRRCSCRHCPLARAIARETGLAVRVLNDLIRFYPSPRSRDVMLALVLPEKLRNFVFEFDLTNIGGFKFWQPVHVRPQVVNLNTLPVWSS